MVVYLAYSLSKKQDKIQQYAIGFIPHVIVLGILAGLILMQPDFGSVVILGLLTWAMLFVGGVRWTHLLSGVAVLVPIAYGVLVSSEYRLKRIMTYLNPWQYPADEGYQIVHSQMAFGTGGLWGTGIGQGYQKLFYLPEPHTDFIFSVIGEELGLWGVLLILTLYTILFWRGITIALRAPDLFGSLLALGLTVAIGLQVFVNMGVALGLLPTKGLALPFLSYGGTSLLMNMAGIGILMNIEATSVK
jgi:cell division protein FtsW